MKKLPRLFYVNTLALSLYIVSSAQAAVVLQYHHIDDNTPSSTSTSISLFKQHIQYLIDNNFSISSIPSIVEDLKNQKKEDNKTVGITFDDGYISVYKNAFPILKKYNIPFTIFVNTAPIEAKKASHVSWEQLREMKLQGATIANHTHQHSYLMSEGLDTDLWKRQFVDEITTAQAIINKRLNQDIKLFAYPYGEFDQPANTLLKEMGYIGFGQQSGATGFNMSLQSLPRYPASNRFGKFPLMAAKLNSTAFEDIEFKPHFGVINETSRNPPTLFIYGADGLVNNVNCFGSSVGALPKVKVDTETFIVSPETPFNTRRFRYNCTAKSTATGRFSWISIPWVDVTKRAY
ncbi:polysaccharide deacetylase family protein [Alkalimarinus alittae]|uniref:Polysaccharide deacetylase family protein n=1 Tax=Alkalimarinus alittae TaxID=2961619 RepID=A0ABY6MXV6_9ALTE|nr:polysaccharide deacetylase family protein [Alkalimarinus alittae]UZE94661.1 polysaccharide deacetylase family protein [Alkalimarinus alittae]